jgi:hypothetical protein
VNDYLGGIWNEPAAAKKTGQRGRSPNIFCCNNVTLQVRMACLASERITQTYLGVLLVVVLLGPNPSRHEIVFDRMGQSKVIVPRRGNIAVLNQRVVQVSVERLLYVSHIFHLSNTSYADLFTFFEIRLHGRHFLTLPPQTSYKHRSLQLTGCWSPSTRSRLRSGRFRVLSPRKQMTHTSYKLFPPVKFKNRPPFAQFKNQLVNFCSVNSFKWLINA